MELGQLYFYTATILNWKHLLETDKFKQIILESMVHLIEKEKVKVYGFVIMPNHIHLIWENLTMNGKEKPHASFMKFTGHRFLEELRADDPALLEQFKVTRNSRNYQFWQRNPLPIRLYDRKILEQKLNYIHLNPLQEHWNLVSDPNDYLYSSCSFYEMEDKRYGWLTHYMDAM
ncbi:MAG: transposase [Sphingobacteriales bacterium]